MEHYDLLIIGAGSGNSILDERFASMRVAIAESGLFGGTCLNAGCIPTKMFVHTADRARWAGDSARFGLDTELHGADWPAIRDRVFGRIDPIERAGRDYRTVRQSHVTVYPEHIAFTGPGTFEAASGARLSADRVVIAAGSRPVIPEITGIDPATVDVPGSPIMTSESVMRMERLPASMTIVGGGFIAAEFAHVFSALGVDVRLAVRGDRLLRTADRTLSERFTHAFVERHRTHLGTVIAEAEVTASGVRLVPAASGDVADAQVPEPWTSDVVLLAAGRAPNVDGLGVEAARIDIADGRIAVDGHQRVLSGGSPLPGVFALGDISSPHLLKHVANHEARVVQSNLLADIASGSVGGAGTDALRRSDGMAVPSAVFSNPQSASVGRTEAQVRAQGIDCTVKIQEYADVAYGWALEDRTGCVKVIAERGSGRILGAHIVGDSAASLIQPLIQAMAFDIPAHRMAREQYWIHPALPEAVENALLGLDIG